MRRRLAWVLAVGALLYRHSSEHWLDQSATETAACMASVTGEFPDEGILAAAAAKATLAESQSVPQVEASEAELVSQKLNFKIALDELSGEDGIAGLPPYRTAAGKDIPAGRSPLLQDDSILRFLRQAQGDPERAAANVIEALRWRRAVLPPAEPQGAAVEMLNEGRRYRELGPNRDGDLVFALDFCWGHFYTEEEGPLNVLRMVLLAVERAFEAADAVDHPQVVLIVFGGPPPCIFSQVCYRFLDKYYPNRLKRAVIYPVPYMWATVVSACLYFLRAETQEKISVVSEEAELVEAAALTGPEQLPEDWRGGILEVDARFHPDKALLNSIIMQYLNPFADSGAATEQAMESSW
eukprot:gb/GFBE01078877.1/.p1 GENE.gb/GFBE01078877.1/~~gb/GFBE01078877.1/.p1  ORF type:complete len:353 (+),score=66.14 gb/GFBE01078877.1/:1-1059(+)